jgi:hypothetical protein
LQAESLAGQRMHSRNQVLDGVKMLKIAPIGFDVKVEDLKDRTG